MGQQENHTHSSTAAWRRRFGLQQQVGSLELGSLEDAGGHTDRPYDRVSRAREEMRRIVIDRLGGDAVLLDAVERIALTSKQALQVLEDAEREPGPEEFSSLEAVVAFDGTRPSFLVKNGEIDLKSSYSTSLWKTMLSSKAEQLSAFASCVGRVEKGEVGFGTAFLVTPTLAITNRHVAQLMARFKPAGIELHQDIHLDFGREYQGRASYDRRAVLRVLFAGVEPVVEPIDHRKLDLALVEVSPSTLSGEQRERCLSLDPSCNVIDADELLLVCGYPGGWKRQVPDALQAEHEAVLAKLLEGDSGVKRLAPGMAAGMMAAAEGVAVRTTTHDATTIGGNSGSPLAVIGGPGKLRAAGLHYGGLWQGQRTNWAHLLAGCAGAQVTSAMDLRTALAQQGVKL